MATLSDDFRRFLQTNYPSDYLLVPQGEVPDDLANSLMAKHARDYAIWCQVPEWIKSRCRDKLPTEVLNGNETVQTYIHKEEEAVKKEEKDNAELMSYSVELLALGYEQETVSTLLQNREDRELLLLEFGDGRLTDAQMDRWLETRLKDMLAIREDWKKNQPEKYALHMAKLLSRNKKRLERGGLTEEQKADVEKKIAVFEREFKKTVRRLESRESRQNMVDYLRGQPQQAALRHLAPSVLSELTAVMKDQGIKIEPARAKARTLSLSGYGSLTESLKNDFARMEKSEDIFRERATRDKQHAVRVKIKAHEVLDKQNEGIAKVVSMRRGSRRQTA